MKKIILAVALSMSLNVAADQATIDNVDRASETMQMTTLNDIEHNSEGYDKAYANYRLGAAYLVQQNIPQVIKHLSKATDILEAQLKSNPNDVESMVLLAQVYGFRIGFEPEKGTTFGPQTHVLLAKASHLAPTNPRLQLVQGIIKYHTPAVYGGNKQLAVTFFSDAIDSYPSDLDSGFHWGHEEAYVWRGLSKIEQGHTQAGIADFKLALDVNPNYGWAKALIAQNTQSD